MTTKERMAYAVLVGAGAAVTTYFSMMLRDRIDTWHLG